MNSEIDWLANSGAITVGNKDAEVFQFLLNGISIHNYKPSALVSVLWEKYKTYPLTSNALNSNALNGKVFESILATVFLLNKLEPVFTQAKVAFVPNVDFDFIFYTKKRGIISISAKTSLRERYKQADLEAIFLKNVHRKSKSYLITLDVSEANTVSNKIKNGDLLGIDKVVIASNSEFDTLINELKTFEFIKPDKISVIESTKILTTTEKYHECNQ